MTTASAVSRVGTRTLAIGATVMLASLVAAPLAFASAGPDLPKAVAYLVAPTQLVDGHYYEAFAGSGFADYSLVLDGAFALAAAGGDDAALRTLVGFVGTGGKDGAGRTIDAWTGIGTRYASGGAIGKEALLAEIVGADPHSFGGHDLIAAIDASVCTQVSVAPDASCPAVGSYRYSPSVFSQALGVIAQLRAGDTTNAAAPLAYLRSLQHPDGSWPSLIPDTGNSDVDSTGAALMALDSTGSAAVAKGQAWIATQQEADGGFPGAAGDSTNSAALALQALSLAAATYAAPIARGVAFLAAEQNSDGGFNVAARGQQGSDVRASTQAVVGAVGTSYLALSRDLTSSPSPSPSPSQSPSVSATPTATASVSATPTASTQVSATKVSASSSTGAAAAGADPQSLPATGTELGLAAIAAALLLVAGTGLLAGARLRRH